MIAFDESFDFVVVGSGAGSISAGLVMRAAGKSVVVLEKTSLFGGTTAKSGGVMWIPDNPFMRRDGVEDSPEQALTYLRSFGTDPLDAPGATDERRRAYVAEAPKMVEFLVRQGVKLTRVKRWPDYYDERPGGSKAGRTVVADLFDARELGAWGDKLRPGFLKVAVTLEEGTVVKTFRQSWAGKRMMLRVGLRTVLSRLAGRRVVAAGEALQGRLLQAGLRAGVEIRLEAPVSELIVEDGAVKGVVAVRDGRPWRIEGRLGVLVNAGGFARNQALRDRYQPGTRAEWSNVAEGDTGEMIVEMIRRGAAIGQMEEMVGYQATIPPGLENADPKPGVQSLTAQPHAILVDQTGVRYLNEGGSYMAYCKAMLERNRTVPAVPSWAVFDQQFLRNYAVAGISPKPQLIEQWLRQGYLRRGETLEALAAHIEVDPATLQATIARFNGFVAQNRDDDFHRGERAYDCWLGDPYHSPSATLGAIAEAPFYAVPVVPGDVGTFGGVVTDSHARVLRADGSAIPGLYATGVSTASVMGRFYPGAGSSIGPSCAFGYIAAKHAAGIDGDVT